MPSTTALGYPIPLDSDPVNDGAESVRNLAQAVDDNVGVIAAGTSTVVLSSAANGSVAVVFPVGRFSAAPVVVASNENSIYHASVSNVTAAGFTLAVRQTLNNTATINVPVSWIAVQQ